MPSRDEIREQLLDYFTEGAPSYRTANDAVRAQAERHADALLPLIDSHIREARINEVHNFGNWNADKGIPELWTAIENRLAELSPKPIEREHS